MVTKREALDAELIDNTFPQDFTIADMFWISAIKDTYERAFNEWKDDIKYMTALSMALNHKIFEWYKKDKKTAQVYNDLFIECDDYIHENFKWDDLTYYFRVTD